MLHLTPVQPLFHEMTSGVCFKNILLPQIEREGKDVTITAFSKMVGYALKVCLSHLLQLSLMLYKLINFMNQKAQI